MQGTSGSALDPSDSQSKHSKKGGSEARRFSTESNSVAKTSRLSADGGGKKTATKKVAVSSQSASPSQPQVQTSLSSKAKPSKPEKGREKLKACEGKGDAATVTRSSEKPAPQCSTGSAFKSPKSSEKGQRSPRKPPHGSNPSSSFPSAAERKEPQQGKQPTSRPSALTTKHSSSSMIRTTSPRKPVKAQHPAPSSVSKQDSKTPSDSLHSKKGVVQKTTASVGGPHRPPGQSLPLSQSSKTAEDKAGPGIKACTRSTPERELPSDVCGGKYRDSSSIPVEPRQTYENMEASCATKPGLAATLCSLSPERPGEGYLGVEGGCHDNLSTTSSSPPSPSPRSDLSDPEAASLLPGRQTSRPNPKLSKTTRCATSVLSHKPTGRGSSLLARRSDGGGSTKEGQTGETGRDAAEREATLQLKQGEREATVDMKQEVSVKGSISHFNLRDQQRGEVGRQAVPAGRATMQVTGMCSYVFLALHEQLGMCWNDWLLLAACVLFLCM